MSSSITIGMDMSDRKHSVCVLDGEGNVSQRFEVNNTQGALAKRFTEYKGSTLALEAGTHSAWVSELLTEMGLDVVVGNPRELRSIWGSNRKSDRNDAEQLARLVRADRMLLHPIKHRGREARLDFETLKARDGLVRCRRTLVNHLRGAVKSFGARVPAGKTNSVVKHARTELPEEILTRVEPLLLGIEALDEQIRIYDKRIERLCRDTYPEAMRLRQINGVGPITALAFVLVIEEPSRFHKSRDVAAYLGLVPRRDQSGDTDKQLHITKAGNSMLRRLLVSSAQYILGPFGKDCDLQRFGLRVSLRGGKNSKKRAAVATARKLAVLMHSLWTHSEEAYEPLRNHTKTDELPTRVAA